MAPRYWEEEKQQGRLPKAGGPVDKRLASGRRLPAAARMTLGPMEPDIATIDEHGDQNDCRHDKHRPRFGGDADDGGYDQRAAEEEAVEPLAGSHKVPFVTDRLAPSIFVGVIETRSFGWRT